MQGNSMESCCGVCELSDFYSFSHLSEEAALNLLKEAILEYCFMDYFYDKTVSIPDFFIAVTREEDQHCMTSAFKALGFHSRRFKSQEDPDRKLLFWSRKGFPRKLRTEIIKRKKELNNDNR